MAIGTEFITRDRSMSLHNKPPSLRNRTKRGENSHRNARKTLTTIPPMNPEDTD